MESIEIVVGKVGRAHGLRGDVTIDVRTDEPERRFAPQTAFATPRGELTVQSTRWHGQRLLARFAEVVDRTAAEALRGVELRVEMPVDERPVDPEEFYDHQLVGLAVQTDAGDGVGEVAEVLHLPAQDVLVVRREGRDQSLIPFVKEIVPTVDLAANRLVVTDQPGLLDARPGRRDDEPEA